ncbi:Na+/H+ antiporter subunit E [Glycomyces sp. TRM65418]|uniref:Na+/H+ antiporter subunit E n=1 Tax=Glycomyces sp. TRM65418 TaxID=2867006 RepID=UPI001CE57150|nr:Na+/H+ antiporter subunit E [Glycomyces sp. TRM65418]MCC3761767.1 Na+/H+ antiporter subunit E [Glycomyces sp. TRM65418]QZD55851.1 Na+/H+ antiporter subunit E [Glycomyces sp. TRM65418]
MRTARGALVPALTWPVRLVWFALYFAREMITANAALTWDILTPSSRLAPGIARFPLRCRTRFEIALLANLISLTPGTLTLAVRREPPTLYVHGMYAPDPDRFRERLRALESRMLAAVRFHGIDAEAAEGGGHERA